MKIFILCRNRPIYLWACLDSLFRLTRTACRFILIDSTSDDPLVRPVIEGFERRGMFESVVWLKRNDAGLVRSTILDFLREEDRLFGFIESDVLLLPGPYECWLERMRQLIELDAKLAMLGSLVDADDFVPLDVARRIAPHLSEYEIRDLTHHEDPERQRHRPVNPDQPIFSPHNPAGRLLILKTDAVLRAGAASDFDLHERLFELGYTTGISTEVRHRHLSLMNIYDYPHYDMHKRNEYMYSLTYKAQTERALRSGEDAASLLTKEPDLHLEVDGIRIEPERGDKNYRFTVPPGGRNIFLVSRKGFALGSPDRRPLGVAIDRLCLDGREALRDSALVRGWRADEGGWRWTSGRAELPSCSTLDVHVVGTVDYVLRPTEGLSAAGLESGFGA